MKHLRLDDSLRLVICPHTHQLEEIFNYKGDEEPTEDFCDGCKEMVDQ